MTTQTEALKLALEALENTYALRDDVIEAITAIKEALAQPEHKPVAWSDAYDMIDRFLQNNLNSDADYAEYSKALDSIYTTPPQRKPLTDEDLDLICEKALFCRISFQQFARSIEAAHGIIKE